MADATMGNDLKKKIQDFDFSHDAINGLIATAISTALRTWEPHLTQMATDLTHKAIDKGRDFTQTGYRKAQAKPIQVLGFAAVALAGWAIFINFKNQSATPKLSTGSATKELH